MIRAYKIEIAREVGRDRHALAVSPMIWTAARRVLWSWCLDAATVGPFPVEVSVYWKDGTETRHGLTLRHHTQECPTLRVDAPEGYAVGDFD